MGVPVHKHSAEDQNFHAGQNYELVDKFLFVFDTTILNQTTPADDIDILALLACPSSYCAASGHATMYSLSVPCTGSMF